MKKLLTTLTIACFVTTLPGCTSIGQPIDGHHLSKSASQKDNASHQKLVTNNSTYQTKAMDPAPDQKHEKDHKALLTGLGVGAVIGVVALAALVALAATAMGAGMGAGIGIA